MRTPKLTIILIISVTLLPTDFTPAAMQKELEAEKQNLEGAKAAIEKAKDKLAMLEMGNLEAGRKARHATIIVVPMKQTTPEIISAITEDMTIMARIFDKKVNPQRTKPNFVDMFIGNHHGNCLPFLTGNDQFTRGLYVQGYGALFLITIDFPLMPPPEIEVEQSASDIDPVWQQTQRELYTPITIPKRVNTGIVEDERGAYYISNYAVTENFEYNSEKVKELKRTLLNLLKYASNIKHINSNESVAIAVTGASQPVLIKKITTKRSSGIAPTVGSAEPTEIKITASSSTTASVMTIRVLKSDVDAFAKGELDFDQFLQLAEIRTTTRSSPSQQ
jgi:hypothetical protein